MGKRNKDPKPKRLNADLLNLSKVQKVKKKKEKQTTFSKTKQYSTTKKVMSKLLIFTDYFFF